jgi:hypothetical protein
MKYLVLSVDRYEFTDERTKEVKSGATVWAVNEYREDTAESAGFKPTKLSIAESLFKTFRTTQLPALFDVDFSAKPGKDGKPMLVVTDAKFLKSTQLFDKKAV